MTQGVLLDRDGVINHERADYVKQWEEFEFLPGVLQAMQLLATLDRPILVVSNQSAIGRGLTTQDAVADIHRRMIAEVTAAGGRIDAVFVCPHRPEENCACRKPRPGLLQQAMAAFDLQPRDCTFIGDALSDLWAAQAAGCQPILVRSGLEGPRLPQLLKNDLGVTLLPDLAHAVTMIIAKAQGKLSSRQD